MAGMIKNYLLIALRNFAKNKNYTLINILGLSIGITSCIILYLLISFDLSFDNFHSHYDRLYRVVRTDQSSSGLEHDAVTPYPFIRAFREDFSDVPLATQFHYHEEGFLTVNTEKHQVKSIVFADSMFFNVFDFGIVSGNPVKELAHPNKAFVTESLAAKLNVSTGDKLKLDNKLEFDIVGLLKDVPPNSHIQYTMVVSMSSFTEDFFGWPVDRWGLNSAGFSYIVLPEKVSEESISNRFDGFVKKYYDEEDAKRTTYLLQPLSDIHFNTTYNATPGDTENIEMTNLLVLAVLGIFILAIACINFVNLATALAVKKSKEIGIRKTLGAKRSQLTVYFLCETLLLTIFAVVISLGVVEWTLPWLSDFMGKDLSMDLFSNPSLVVFLLLLVLMATLFSGFYPAVILSGFEPVAVLKNKINARGTSGAWVRRGLVIFQFITAQMLIIGTLVVHHQMNYLKSKPLGFIKDAIVNVSLPTNKEEQLNNFRTRLESNPSIKNVSFAVGPPTSDANIGTGFYREEKGVEENYPVSIKTVDIHYKDTYGIKLKSGRWFLEGEAKTAADTTLPNSERFSFIVNEAAVRKLGFASAEEALGRRVHIGLNDITAPIVGVTEDFHTQSLRSEVQPVVMIIFPRLYFDAGMSISTTNIPATLDYIKETWTTLYPEYYFEYRFLDQELEALYRDEQRQLSLFKVFAGISIFIGCLGLLGLVSFMAQQKLKEIGVRKVFGASVINILGMFSKEFVRLVILAFLIAAPLSWYLMGEWLQNFEYRISIHWSVYLIALAITIAIALATVAYRSLRAGLTNPVESMRSE